MIIKEGKERGVALVCNLEGCIVAVTQNQTWLPSNFEVGTFFVEYLDEGSRAKAGRFFAEIVTREAAFNWELLVKGGDDSLPVLFFSGARNEDNIVIVGVPNKASVDAIVQDLMALNNEQVNFYRKALKNSIKRRKNPIGDEKLYEELARLNNEMVNLQRDLSKKNTRLNQLIKQKDLLLGMAAHDLRNPMNVIMNFSLYLSEDESEGLSEDGRDLLKSVYSTSEFMLQLIDEILEISQIESGNLKLNTEAFDFGCLVKRQVRMNQTLANKKNIKILEDIPDDLPSIIADEGKVTQVLANLLSNAVKYSDPDSHIWVQVRKYDDEHILIDVKDEGQGIHPNEITNLFKPFQKTSSKTTGGEMSTGLGLAIAKRIVDGHMGNISVKSQPGIGSTFTVKLPLVCKGGFTQVN